MGGRYARSEGKMRFHEKRRRLIFLDSSPDSHWFIAGVIVGALFMFALWLVVAK
jgi:hypothetical protein